MKNDENSEIKKFFCQFFLKKKRKQKEKKREKEKGEKEKKQFNLKFVLFSFPLISRYFTYCFP